MTAYPDSGDGGRRSLAGELASDIRFALRHYRRAPGFTAIAVLTIALGIGVNAAMFGIVDGILLRALPYPEPEQLVRLYQASPEHGLTQATISPVDFDDWRERTRSFTAMAAYREVTVNLTGDGEPLELAGAIVSGGFFDVLGVPVLLGRPLIGEDIRLTSRNAVVSHSMWTRLLGGDPAIIGSQVRIGFAGDEPFTVVGVAAPGFRYPTADTDIWLPKTLMTPDMVGPRERGNRYLEGIARLAPGVPPERAHAELSGVAAQLAAEHPASNAEWRSATVLPLKTVLVGDVDRALVVVLGVVGFILLIACANLANLLLARGAGRVREMAIRTALGAGRGRLVRQLLTESVLLGLAGGLVGVALSVWILRTMLLLSADTLPRVEAVSVDGRVLGFGLLLALLTGLLFGLLPALRLARPHDSLRGSRGTVGTGGRLRGALVVAEVGMAVILVIGAGLMARSFLELRRVHPGFDPERVLTVTMQLNMAGVPESEAVQHIIRRREEFIEGVQALPGVVAAATNNALPLRTEGEPFDFTRAEDPDATPLRASRSYISTDYFRAMGIPLLRGETLSAEPVMTWPLPMVISETTARRMWPGEDPIGRQAMTSWGGPFLVIGVVADVRQHGLAQDPPPAVYFSQDVGPRVLTTLVVRTAGDPLTLAQPVRQAIREIDPAQPIRSIAPLEGVIAESVARDRFFTLLFGVFGGLALALAALGIYGVLAYSVGQRTQEIGVRMALGARTGDVLIMVVRDGMLLVGAGIVLGTGAGLLLARLLESLLYGISAADPLSIGGSIAVLAVVALLASYLPARRATRVEPTVALRGD